MRVAESLPLPYYSTCLWSAICLKITVFKFQPQIINTATDLINTARDLILHQIYKYCNRYIYIYTNTAQDWYGLDAIHCLSQTGQWEMRVDYQKNDNTWSYLSSV